MINKQDKLFLSKFNSTGSGIISSITQSEGIIQLEENTNKIKKGTFLKFLKFQDFLN